MDVQACNYNIEANTDSGTCTYPAIYYDCTGACLNDEDGDGVCNELEIAGCTDPATFNYDSTATDDDGSCIDIIYGCTDDAAVNYNPNANEDDDSCVYYGCTNNDAANYDPDADIDDGSCVIYGCNIDAVSYTHLTLPTKRIV